MSGDSPRVLLGMSGGVDSSISAWMLKRDGYQVVGVTLLFHDSPRTYEKLSHARQVADQLGIEHHVIDARDRFADEVEAAFVRDVERGITANPCIRCSVQLKVPLLFEQADELECPKVATGHYARVTTDEFGVGLRAYQLRSPLDRAKDQTFLLYQLTQEQLSRLVFPLEQVSKPVVRRMAMQAGLQRLSPLHDGQGVPCFFDEGTSADWLQAQDEFAGASGSIVDIGSGRVVGHHEGLFRYVLGQPVGSGLRVIAKDPERDTLLVGSANLATTELVVLEGMHWTSIEPPSRRRSCRARIAYDAKPVPAQVLCTDDGVVVTFTKPVSGLGAGLPVVLYSDDLVLGGGLVAR